MVYDDGNPSGPVTCQGAIIRVDLRVSNPVENFRKIPVMPVAEKDSFAAYCLPLGLEGTGGNRAGISAERNRIVCFLGGGEGLLQGRRFVGGSRPTGTSNPLPVAAR